MKKIYFLSDIHLGSRASNDTHERERKLCRFLDSIRHDAKAIYFLGDVFDFWFEYHNVVPKGYTRFLGKLSELADQGIEASIDYTEQLGSETVLHLKAQGITFTAVTETQLTYRRGQEVHIQLNPRRFHFFDENGMRI